MSVILETPAIAALMERRDRAHRRGQFGSEKRLSAAIYKQRHADLRLLKPAKRRKRGGRV